MTMKRSRSIFKHALAITIVTFVVVGVGTAGYILWQMQQHRDMVAAAHQEREDMADRIWKAKTENFQNAVRDNSAWDDLVDFRLARRQFWLYAQFIHSRNGCHF